MSGPEGEERLRGSRGDRRFSALNPHGNIDFVLPSGGVSEYLGKPGCEISVSDSTDLDQSRRVNESRQLLG